jgi:hypothetical protein
MNPVIFLALLSTAQVDSELVVLPLPELGETETARLDADVRAALVAIGVFRIAERADVEADVAAAKKAGVELCTTDDLPCLASLRQALGDRPLLLVGGSVGGAIDALTLAVVRPTADVVVHSTRVEAPRAPGERATVLEGALDRVLGGGAEVGSLQVITEPAGATVLIDGVERGGDTVDDLAVGKHLVTVRAAGVERDVIVDVMPGALARAHVSLASAPAPSATTTTEPTGGLSLLTVVGAGLATGGTLLAAASGAGALAIDYTLFNTDVGGTREDRAAMQNGERALVVVAAVGGVAAVAGAGVGVAGLLSEGDE